MWKFLRRAEGSLGVIQITKISIRGYVIVGKIAESILSIKTAVLKDISKSLAINEQRWLAVYLSRSSWELEMSENGFW